jgi:hypothetical protein
LFEFWENNGYINNKGKLIDNVRIVSLGDLIDYGTNSIDVLYAMTKLRELNPGKVMLLAGNHEGTVTQCSIDDLNGRSKLNSEFNSKNFNIGKVSGDLIVNMTAYERMRYFTHITSRIGPSMLSLRFEGDKYRMCMMHGMYPGFRHTNNTSESIPLEKDVVLWWPTLNRANLTYKDLIQLTQWNDLAEIDNQEITGNGRGNMTTSSGMFRMISWNMKDLQRLMVEQGIKAFFRGHQDLCPTQVGPFDRNCNNTVAIYAHFKESASGYFGRTIKKSCSPETVLVDETWCVKNMPGIATIPVVNDPNDRIEKHIYTTSMASEKTFRRDYDVSITPLGGFIRINVRQNKSEGESIKIRKKTGGTDIQKTIPDSMWKELETPKQENKCNVKNPKNSRQQKPLIKSIK